MNGDLVASNGEYESIMCGRSRRFEQRKEHGSSLAAEVWWWSEQYALGSLDGPGRHRLRHRRECAWEDPSSQQSVADDQSAAQVA